VLSLTPLALWGAFFAVHAPAWGVGWSAELVGGALVLSVLSGIGVGLLSFPPPAPAGSAAL